MGKKSMILFCLAPLFAAAQNVSSARLAYQQQQALDEVPRLVKQFDQLLQNQDAIVARLQRVEAALNAADRGVSSDEVGALRAEVADLKASMRREQDRMRREIVDDLARRMKSLVPPPAPAQTYAPPPAAAPAQPASRPAQPVVGPHYEYVVEKGQTLSLIAAGFETTVEKILAANPGLKANRLRVGQKLIIPAEEAAKPAPAKPAKPAPAKGKRARK